MKLEIYRQVFQKKKLKYETSLKFVQLEPSCSMLADRHGEADSRVEQLCKPKMTSV